MRSLCITSGKGGVGKTTLAVNLGIAIARLGKRVLLLDGDMGLANINVQMGIIPEFTIYDAVQGRKTLPEIVFQTPYGLDLVAGGSGIAELADLGIQERESVMRGLNGLQVYDVLIIDTGAGIADSVIRFILAAEHALIVTTAEPTSLTDAYGMIKTIVARQPKPLKLLVNRATSAAEARHVFTRLNSVTGRFINYSLDDVGYIPYDPLIEKSIYQQKPHLVLNPTSASARSIREVASRLVGGHESEGAGGWGRFLKSLLGS
jgi:flagellar biosynthesis protein FlhG